MQHLRCAAAPRGHPQPCLPHGLAYHTHPGSRSRPDHLHHRPRPRPRRCEQVLHHSLAAPARPRLRRACCAGSRRDCVPGGLAGGRAHRAGRAGGELAAAHSGGGGGGRGCVRGGRDCTASDAELQGRRGDGGGEGRGEGRGAACGGKEVQVCGGRAPCQKAQGRGCWRGGLRRAQPRTGGTRVRLEPKRLSE